MKAKKKQKKKKSVGNSWNGLETWSMIPEETKNQSPQSRSKEESIS